MSAPRLFDRDALLAHRARAGGADPGALFLHREARDEVEERLRDVNRTFTAPAVVTGHPGEWDLPGATVVPDDPVLALEEGAHDLVVHALALHWADDPVGQLIQCRRALRPDGLLLVATLGGETLSELRAALAEAEARVAGGLSPRVAPMGEIRDLGALLGRAGLALPVADATTRTVRYRDLPHLVGDLRAMGETSALRGRRPASRHLIAEAARIYRDAFPDGDGIRATFQTVFLTGWAPHESQQTPLRPGSARARLADALKVPEVSLNDPPAGGTR